MSRCTITVTGSDGRSDSDATIGYDPPLRTFFLQAFPDDTGDDLALWLGTADREYETLDALHAAALAERFDFIPLPDDLRAQLASDHAQASGRPDHDGPLAALLRHPVRLAPRPNLPRKAHAGLPSGMGLCLCSFDHDHQLHSISDASR